MSAKTALAPIVYDPANVYIGATGLAPSDLQWLGPQLESARQHVLDDIALWNSGDEIPETLQPLDAGFIELPERLLADYAKRRESSELGQITQAAKRLSETIDKFVVLGIGGSYMGARALFEACCHPYYNELPRGERAGRPRIYFEGNNVDNDALHGLLDVLGGGAPPASADDQWGLSVISKSGGTLETASAFRVLLAAIVSACGGDRQAAAQRIVPVTGPSGRLRDLAAALGCPEVFNIPDGVGGRFSIFTAVGLFPAAVLGLDVHRLLEGAAAMNERFRKAAVGENPVLDYVGVCHLLETRRGMDVRILSTWGRGLEAAGFWYDQLLSESLGKDERGALPLTVVNTRDLHSRGQQHQEGARDKVITNLYPESFRRDRLFIGPSDLDQDKLNGLADKSYPELLAAALAGTNQAYRDAGRPTADLRLPALDEASLGQYFQMMMLATVAEGRLIGINPYGQPGVEDYKRNMNAILRGK